MPTVMSTWFSGRMASTFMRGLSSKRWITAPSTKRAGMVIRSAMYGSMLRYLKSTKVRYMATIMSWPWARLMMCITPMIKVMPMPMSA